ncbi:hypothetical protein L083_0686 [Actinoplanes sp. N902-109]|nr:hypothetical protein L083_0686 [Actinoplanes sp. N902-109]
MALAGLAIGLGVTAVHASAGTATGIGPAGPAAVTARSTGTAATGTLVALYTFDGGRAGSIRDDSGNGHTLTLVSGNGGTVSAVPHRSGQAIRFPAKCTTTASACPHAALRSATSPQLNPGTRALAYGASVLLAHSQTTKGQNILQKGYSTSSSQWKLQIDGTAGFPSCVLVGANPGIKIVRSTVSVADGHWHTVECRRRSTSFTVLVDGVVRGTREVSAKLSIANQRPLSIGGKGAYADNDQFQGILDDVWVRVG